MRRLVCLFVCFRPLGLHQQQHLDINHIISHMISPATMADCQRHLCCWLLHSVTRLGMLLLSVAMALQVVVVAAGFDTRAYRIGAKYKGVTFFEVDLPHASK